MRLLLDTHALIWWVGQLDRMPQRVRQLLLTPAHSIFVSAVSAWEIASKVRRRRLVFDPEFLVEFEVRTRGLGFQPLSITATHAVTGAGLPGRHGDPFDRMLTGQALVEGLTVVTVDPAIATLGAAVVW